MNVYVASSFARKPCVRAMHDLLRAAGHSISHDWTPEDATPYLDERLREDLHRYLRRGAKEDLDAVLRSHALVVLHDDRGRGMASEFGAALAKGIPCIVVGARVATGEMRNVFYYLPEVIHVDEPEDAISALHALAPVWTPVEWPAKVA